MVEIELSVLASTAWIGASPIARYIQGRGVLASIGQHVGELGRQPC